MSETGTVPGTVTGDWRGSAGTGIDQGCEQYARGGPKNVTEIFKGQALANPDALAKGRSQ